MRQLQKININNILFFDIETAPAWEYFKQVPDYVKKEWIYKFKFRDNAPKEPTIDEDNVNSISNYDHFLKSYNKYFSDLWKKEAGLYPEFSRIVCISFGLMWDGQFTIKSHCHESEEELLKAFALTITSVYNKNPQLILCAHNGKGFDIPFTVKRMLMFRMEIPFVMDTYGLKPWEMTTLLDTLEIWRMGSQQGAGLPSISMHFGLPSPKDDIEGSDVSKCYHNGEIDRIRIYCEKDVIALVNVFKAMRSETLLTPDQICIR